MLKMLQKKDFTYFLQLLILTEVEICNMYFTQELKKMSFFYIVCLKEHVSTVQVFHLRFYLKQNV